MPSNTRNNLFDSIFSNTSSPIAYIEKAYVQFYMGASKYLPHYKISCVKWVLVLHIYIYSNQSSMVINLRGLDKYESNHRGDEKTDGQTRTEVCTGNIY